MAAETIIDFLQEARQSLEEVAYAIREGKMSNTLQCDSSCVHLNLTTLEGLRFCVRLSLRGFEVHLFLSRSQLSAAIHTLLPLHSITLSITLHNTPNLKSVHSVSILQAIYAVGSLASHTLRVEKGVACETMLWVAGLQDLVSHTPLTPGCWAGV